MKQHLTDGFEAAESFGLHILGFALGLILLPFSVLRLLYHKLTN